MPRAIGMAKSVAVYLNGTTIGARDPGVSG